MFVEMGEWRKRAACKDLGALAAEIFFPENTKRGVDPYVRARAICETCPVRIDCLDEAIENKEQYDMWGGMNLRERRKEARRRKLAAAGGKK